MTFKPFSVLSALLLVSILINGILIGFILRAPQPIACPTSPMTNPPHQGQAFSPMARRAGLRQQMGLQALPRYLTKAQRQDFNHQMDARRKEMRGAIRDMHKARALVLEISQTPHVDRDALREAMDAAREASANVAKISDAAIAQYLGGLSETERREIFTAMDDARPARRRRRQTQTAPQ